MDQRIAYVATLKNVLSQRTSMGSMVPADPPEQESLDQTEYQFMRKQIVESAFWESCGKHVRIRLGKWLERLDRVSSNKVWVANRNNYAKLLNLMCHCEHITSPFLQLPPPPHADLPHLPKHEITRIIDQVERQIKTSRFVSRKASIAIDAPLLKQKTSICNYISQQKRFKTESNTYGEEESDTVVLRNNWNPVKTFETDFEDKTISFNLSSTEKNWFSKTLKDEDECDSMEKYQTKPLRNTSHSKPTLRQITNFDTKPNQNIRLNSTITPPKTKPPLTPTPNEALFKKKAKPPLYKQIKLNDGDKKCRQLRTSLCKHKQYWESNELTVNNSGVGTPKYLDKYQLNSEQLNDSVVIVSYREDADNCDCTNKMLGDGWLSQMIKKIAQ